MAAHSSTEFNNEALKKIHDDALKKIEKISDDFYSKFNREKTAILNGFQKEGMVRNIDSIRYPPFPEEEVLPKKHVFFSEERGFRGKHRFPEERRVPEQHDKFLLNKIKFFSDHLPIFEENENTVIISWNIGIGENNSPWPYQIIAKTVKAEVKTKYKNNKTFKTNTVECMVNIINTYVTDMEEYGKPIVLHLQECSYDVYNKLKDNFKEKNFSGSFMPQELAKAKSTTEARLYYIEERLKYYPSPEIRVGLSSFIFPITKEDTTNIKIYPTSAELSDHWNKDDAKYELVLKSRINLVYIQLNDQIYIHYNLHLKKDSPEVNNRESKTILINYSKKKFINIEDTSTEETKSLKPILIKTINDCVLADNIIKIFDGKLKFFSSLNFNNVGARYMCGDFNTKLARLTGFPTNIKINRNDTEKIDYIVKIEDVEEVEVEGEEGMVDEGVRTGVVVAETPGAEEKAKGVVVAETPDAEEKGVVVTEMPDVDEKAKGVVMAEMPGAEDIDGVGWKQKYFKYKSKYLKLKEKYRL